MDSWLFVIFGAIIAFVGMSIQRTARRRSLRVKALRLAADPPWVGNDETVERARQFYKFLSEKD